MRLAMCVSVLMALAGVARGGDCVTAQDLAQGIEVSTANGATYHYTSNGKRVLASMVVKTGRKAVRYDLTFMAGIFLTKQVRTYSDPGVAGAEPVVGGIDGEVWTDQFSYPAMPAMTSGQGFVTEVGYTGDATGPSIGPQPQQKTMLEARFAEQAEQMVTWDGCPYRIRPVEVQMLVTAQTQWIVGGAEVQPAPADQVGKPLFTRRMLYFPDLGFAVITKMGPGRGEGGKPFANGLNGLARAGG